MMIVEKVEFRLALDLRILFRNLVWAGASLAPGYRVT